MAAEPKVTFHPARDGYCTACGYEFGTIAQMQFGTWITRVCSPCARKLRRALRHYAKTGEIPDPIMTTWR